MLHSILPPAFAAYMVNSLLNASAENEKVKINELIESVVKTQRQSQEDSKWISMAGLKFFKHAGNICKKKKKTAWPGGIEKRGSN